jgi:hypothetical protein
MWEEGLGEEGARGMRPANLLSLTLSSQVEERGLSVAEVG